MKLIDADNIVFDCSGLIYIDPTDYKATVEYFAKQIRAIPAAAAPERKRGKWQFVDHYGERYRVCSVCSVERLDDFSTGMNYCPNCGADMKEEEEKE